MNNFCTKCGTKLDEKALVCPNCNLAVVDDTNAPEVLEKEKVKNKMIRKKVITIIFVILIIYFGFNFARHNFNTLDIKKNIKNLLTNESYEKITVTKVKHCKRCNGSCDGSCYDYKSIPNCYIYSLKITFKNKDVINTSAKYTLTTKELPNDTISDYLNKKNIIDKYFSNTYENIIYEDNISHIYFEKYFNEHLNLDLIENLTNINNSLLKESNEHNIELNYKDGYLVVIDATSPYITLYKPNANYNSSKSYSFYNASAKPYYNGGLSGKIKTNNVVLKELEDWIVNNAR